MSDLQAFDGDTYDPKRDYVRLKGQLWRVYHTMAHNGWWTLADIEDFHKVQGFYDSQAAISARLRDLRKSKYGGHIVEREHVGNGLYRYRLKLNSAPVSVGSPNAGSLRAAGAGAESIS